MPWQELNKKKPEAWVTCNRCGGSGKDIQIAIGLGQNKIEPAYVNQTCPACRGKGKVHIANSSAGMVSGGCYYKPQGEMIPTTFFIEKLLKKFGL